MFLREALKLQNAKMAAPLRQAGLYLFDSGAVAIATTNIDDVNDEVRLVKFPDQCRLIDFQVTATDMDTNATPTLAFDIRTDDGSTEVLYISATTIGQAGGTDEVDLAVNLIGTDVSNLYLSTKVTTVSATGAAGTIRVKGLVWLGNRIAL